MNTGPVIVELLVPDEDEETRWLLRERETSST